MRKNSEPEIREITARDVWERVPERVQDSHKGTYGKLLCIAGSSRYRGAAALTVEGALRSGCGIVTLATVEPVFASVQPRLPEAILIACEADTTGGISRNSLDRLLQEREQDYAALLLGPGMGNTPDTAALVRGLVTGADCTVLLDADALNALSLEPSSRPAGKTSVETAPEEHGSRMDIPGSRSSVRKDPQDTLEKPEIRLPQPAAGRRIIITPHPGEMARLCGLTIPQLKQNRERIALQYARENNCIVVLKEHRTLIATPEGRLWKNTSGNSGLARGGSGDILAGMTGALAAQGMSPEDAALCAVWLHGAAAEHCSARKSETGMLPHDLFDDLGQLFLKNGR